MQVISPDTAVLVTEVVMVVVGVEEYVVVTVVVSVEVAVVKRQSLNSPV